MSDDEKETCPICYDNDLLDEYVLTKCRHKFCPKCYAMHIRKNSNCPMCRSEIAPENVYKSMGPDKAVQLIHLELLSNPHLIPLMEEALGMNDVNKSEEDKVNDIFKVFTSFGMGVAGRIKRWYNTH
jgi:hypothetical protein